MHSLPQQPEFILHTIIRNSYTPLYIPQEYIGIVVLIRAHRMSGHHPSVRSVGGNLRNTLEMDEQTTIMWVVVDAEAVRPAAASGDLQAAATADISALPNFPVALGRTYEFGPVLYLAMVGLLLWCHWIVMLGGLYAA